MSPVQVEHILGRLRDEGKGITAWEKHFIDSCENNWSAGRSLTEEQETILQDIYETRIK